MGLFTHTLAGGGLMLIGTWEVFISSYATLHPSSSSSSSPPLSPPPPSNPITKKTKPHFFYSIRFIAVALLSSFVILDSLISLTDALNYKDRVGFALQLEVISIASLFLLYSVFGLLLCYTNFFPIPSSLLDLIALFAFGQEFLHFYVQKKDPDGLENRYFDLLLVPITACVFTTIVELGGYKSNFPSFGRGVALILQGTWFVQMGFSFYTNAMAQGCDLVEKSRGNFSVMCKGHMASHRSNAIATLQFNCHLAFLVVVAVGVYAVVAHMYGLGSDYLNYKPLNEEMQQLDNQAQYTLESDDENVVEETLPKSKDNSSNDSTHISMIKAESGVNGFGDSLVR